MSVERPNLGDYLLGSPVLPWHDVPGRLISWLEMNKFSAAEFVEWMGHLRTMSETLDRIAETRNRAHGINLLKNASGAISEALAKVGCKVAAAAADRLSQQMDEKWPVEVLRSRTKELHATIIDEMESHLFFWVPEDRAGFYGKTGRCLLGDECVDRFAKSDIANEAEQAAKCFAFGQYTACVFHLMRICEAGVRALALAIGYQWEASPNWGKFFKQYDAQLATNPSKYVGPWLTHAEFLESAGGHLRAVKDAWRNDTMHLDKSYDVDQAKHLLAVVPAFMRQIATKLDETGLLY